MTIGKTSLIAAVEFGVRAVLTLVILKVMALKGGAAGVVLYGQFQNGIAILTLVGGGLFTNGIIRYSAEYGHDKEFQINLWRSAISYSFIAGSILAIFCFVFAPFLNTFVFYNHASVEIIRASALLLIPCFVQTVFIAISNGIEKVKLLATIRLVSAGFLVLSFLTLLYFWGSSGALVSLTLGPALGCLFSLFIFHRLGIFKTQNYGAIKISPNLRVLLKYGVMAVASTMATPLVLMYLRGFAQNKFGITQLGNWEGSFRIADQSLALISSVLGVYFLPKISKLKGHLELKTEVEKVFIYVFIVVTTGACGVFLFRELLIHLLLSPDFYLAKDLIGIQVTVSVFKILSWVYAFVMLAKGLWTEFIIGELLAAVCIVAATFLLSYLGIESLCYGFLIGYLVYFIYCRFIFLNYLAKLKKASGESH